jgi:DNA-binding Xre family transcriptional regulator
LDPQLDEDCKIQQARHFLEIIENGKGKNISLTKTQKLCQ